MRENTVETAISGALPFASVVPAASLWTPEFVRLLAAGSAYGFAFSSFHLMPKYLAVEFAASPAEFGWSAGTFGIASVLTSLVVGAWIDRVSRRRMFAASAILFALTSLGFAAVDSMGAAVLILRAVQGVAFTMQMASFSTLVAELAPAARLGEAVGLAGSSMLIMNAVAPAIDEPLARAAGWPAAYLLAALAAGLALVLIMETGPRRRVLPGATGSFWAVWRRPTTRVYASVTFLTAIAFAAMFTFLQPAALESGYRDVGAFFVAYAVAACAVRLLCGWLPDRYGRRRVAVVALVPYTLVVGYVAVAGPTTLIGIGAVLGLAHGVFFPALNSLAIEYTRPSERGRLMTVFAGTFNFGAWGGAAGLGMIAERFGLSAVFSVGAACALAALVTLARTDGFRFPADIGE